MINQWQELLIVAGIFVVGVSVPQLLRRLAGNSPRKRPLQYAVDETGISEIGKDSGGKKYSWNDVNNVAIMTTSGGPLTDDFFFVIKTDHGDIVIDQFAAEQMHLMDYFKVLPGFDWGKVAEASGCTSDAVFQCWSRSAPSS